MLEWHDGATTTNRTKAKTAWCCDVIQMCVVYLCMEGMPQRGVTDWDK